MADHPAPDQAAQLPAPDPPPLPPTEPRSASSLTARERFPSLPSTNINYIRCTYDGASPPVVSSLRPTLENNNRTKFIANQEAPPEASPLDIETEDGRERIQTWVNNIQPPEKTPPIEDLDGIALPLIPQRDPSEPAFDPIAIVNGRRLERATKEGVINGGKTTRRWENTPFAIVWEECEERRMAMEAFYEDNPNCEPPLETVRFEAAARNTRKIQMDSVCSELDHFDEIIALANAAFKTACQWSSVDFLGFGVSFDPSDEQRWRTVFKVQSEDWDRTLPSIISTFFVLVRNLLGWELCPRDMPTITVPKEYFWDPYPDSTTCCNSTSVSLCSIVNGIASVHWQAEDHRRSMDDQICVEINGHNLKAYYKNVYSVDCGQTAMTRYELGFSLDSVIRVIVDHCIQSPEPRGHRWRLYIVVSDPLEFYSSMYNENIDDFEWRRNVPRLVRGDDISTDSINECTSICFEFQDQRQMNGILGKLAHCTFISPDFATLDQVDMQFRCSWTEDHGPVLRETPYEVSPSTLYNWEIHELMRAPWTRKLNSANERLRPEVIERKVQKTMSLLEETLLTGFCTRNQLLISRRYWKKYVWKVTELLGHGKYVDVEHERRVVQMMQRVLEATRSPRQTLSVFTLLEKATRSTFPNYSQRFDQDDQTTFP